MKTETRNNVVLPIITLGIITGLMMWALIGVVNSVDCDLILERDVNGIHAFNELLELHETCVSTTEAAKIVVFVFMPVGAVVFTLIIKFGLGKKDYYDKDLTNSKEGSAI